MEYLNLKKSENGLLLCIDDYVIEPKSDSEMEVFCVLDKFYNDVEAGKIPEDLKILADRLEGNLRKPSLTERIKKANDQRQIFSPSQQVERPALAVIEGGKER